MSQMENQKPAWGQMSKSSAQKLKAAEERDDK
jgi:hypothetical protein